MTVAAARKELRRHLAHSLTYGVAACNLRLTVDEAALEIAQRARETGLQ